MRYSFWALTLLWGSTSLALPQHGTAPTGYYPECLAGDVWTGTLTTVDDANRRITLTYTNPKHKQVETFVGVIEDGYTVSRRGGPRHELRPSELTLGTHLRVYYCEERKKVEGK